MDVRHILRTSLEYVPVEMQKLVGGVPADPTTDAVVMAFIAPGTVPVSGDFKASTWQTDTSGLATRYYARCLVGPGGTVTLTAGKYEIFVKVTDSPEIPITPAGFLVVD